MCQATFPSCRVALGILDACRLCSGSGCDHAHAATHAASDEDLSRHRASHAGRLGYDVCDAARAASFGVDCAGHDLAAISGLVACQFGKGFAAGQHASRSGHHRGRVNKQASNRVAAYRVGELAPVATSSHLGEVSLGLLHFVTFAGLLGLPFFEGRQAGNVHFLLELR